MTRRVTHTIELPRHDVFHRLLCVSSFQPMHFWAFSISNIHAFLQRPSQFLLEDSKSELERAQPRSAPAPQSPSSSMRLIRRSSGLLRKNSSQKKKIWYLRSSAENNPANPKIGITKSKVIALSLISSRWDRWQQSLATNFSRHNLLPANSTPKIWEFVKQ